MKWRVENALNRDVERQHLNKILKEIENKIGGIDKVPSTQEIVRTVERIVRDAAPDALTSVRVELVGDVHGQGTSTSTGRVVVNATIDPSKLGVPEAPMDGREYWRVRGTWEPVPSFLSSIGDLDIAEPGMLVKTEEDLYTTRTITGVEDEIDVTYGNGSEGDPLIGLADVVPEPGGTIKTLSFDSKGRRVEEEEADTDDLPEGAVNLYHTDERAQDAVGSILADTTHISLTYDDNIPSIYAELTNENLASIADVVASDGDILEWQGIDSEWEVTKSPRLLHLDGGNF